MSKASGHAVVIGGTSGIGLAAARRLLADGLKVTVAGRSERRIAAAREALAGVAEVAPLDGADPQQVREFFRALGAFDHLVLALGSGRGMGAFASLDLAEVRRGFEEKVWPHLSCAQAALPTIRKDGSITFVAAVSAQMAAPGTVGLAAANGALSVVTPILAAELRPLRVNAVSPGVVDTAWWDFMDAEQREAAFANFAGRTPVGRVGTPDDIAKAIAFLVADGFVSGHVLVCDGGLRLAA
jgi:NAD(P)-dependent dehydrogenase (short-subunit alcohol dehydrogenase family)